MSEYAFHYFVNYGTVIFLFWLCIDATICDSFYFFSAQFVGHCANLRTFKSAFMCFYNLSVAHSWRSKGMLSFRVI